MVEEVTPDDEVGGRREVEEKHACRLEGVGLNPSGGLDWWAL